MPPERDVAARQRWVELGQELIRQRVDLGFPTRPAFARHNAERHPGSASESLYRNAEKAYRTNISASALAQLERDYQLPPGSIGEFLAGERDTLAGLRRPDPSVLRQAAAQLIRYADDIDRLQSLMDAARAAG